MAVDTAPRDDFRQKLILSIVDKLVFGLLIVLAGFVLNLVLENHRADQALKSEIARVRVQKVAQMWQVLDRHQRAVSLAGRSEANLMYQGFSSETAPATVRPPDLKAMGRLVAKRRAALKQEQRSLVARLNANRFWIGERLYPRYVEYFATQKRLLAAYQDVADAITETYVRGRTHGKRDAALQEELIVTYERGMQRVKERARELKVSRADVFSAMERLS
jgi:hypothetical protein